MIVTRADVERTIRCGDGIAVTYREANGTAKLLRWAEGGRATHFIECFGGLDTFEETIGGGMHTNLDTYLRGNCDLRILRAPVALTASEQCRVRSYWMSLVAEGYGWDSIKRSALTVPIRRFVKPHYPRLARVMRGAARALLPGAMPDCSAAWVDGMRLVRRKVMLGCLAEEVDPFMLWADRHLIRVADWTAPVLKET